MAHEVEQMAYVGEVPWHGLGNKVDANTSIEEWQTVAGLDWTVSKRPVLFPAAEHEIGDKPLSFKDKFVLARDTDNRAFSVVSGRYKPVQPAQILEFFRDLIADFGMVVETAGSLRDGQRVWALAKTGDAHKVMGVDKVDSYLMLATSYDLTFSTLAQFTSVRVVCNNTLQQSFRAGNNSGRISIPHFRDFDMAKVKQDMGVGREQWSAFTETLDTLAKIKMYEGTARQVLRKVFEIGEDIAVTPDASVKISHMERIMTLFNGKGMGSDIAGATGWGLVNAVTQYVDHSKRARSQGNRLDNAWFGEGAAIKARTVEETLLTA